MTDTSMSVFEIYTKCYSFSISFSILSTTHLGSKNYKHSKFNAAPLLKFNLQNLQKKLDRKGYSGVNISNNALNL